MASIDQTVAFLYSFWQMKLPTTFRAGEQRRVERRQSRRFLANATTLPRAPLKKSPLGAKIQLKDGQKYFLTEISCQVE